MDTDVAATPPSIAETDRLGDEIAELFAHLEATGAHLLDLIREFDARGGWNEGFRHGTKQPDSTCMRGWRVRAGWASISTWDGLSTPYIPLPLSPWRSASRKWHAGS